MMDVQLNEPGKWQRGGFLSSLNRSFRLTGGKLRGVNSSPTENKTMELLDTPTVRFTSETPILS